VRSGSQNREWSVKTGWNLYPQDRQKSASLARELNVPEVVAQVLLNRGIETVEEGRLFLEPSLSLLHSPFLMRDIGRAADILLQAVQKGRRIAVYGDYDVDGVTSTALLFSVLQRQLGGKVTCYIPNRLQEGYGLNFQALEHLAGEGVSLLLTVDCGINAVEEVAYAGELGMEVVVTDHHRPLQALPDAAAVANPFRDDCAYPFKELAGVGVAFKLGQALLSSAGREDCIWDYLDLVALGTVADVCPLLGENRIFVTHGLRMMGERPRAGLKALARAAGLSRDRFTAEDIAFIISPRLNAAGRMGEASRSLRLIMEEDEARAFEIAGELNEENSRRQGLEAAIFAEACRMVEDYPEERGRNLLILAREGWHHGVLGVVASRMVEKYNRPVVLIAVEEGIGKGSGRSTGDFNLTAALESCSAMLTGYGGHKSAAGLTVEEKYINPLRDKLDNLAGEFFASEGEPPAVNMEAQLEPADITAALASALEALEPHGFGNPRPVFLGKGWLLEKKRGVGKNQRHLQLGLKKEAHFFEGISFNGKRRLPQLDAFREIDLVFTVSFNQWRGEKALQLEVCHFAYSDEYKMGSYFLVDRRGLRAKTAYVKELLQKGDAVFVFVNTIGRLHYLEKIFGGWDNIAFTHQGSPPAARPQKKPRHIVLYDLPILEEKLNQMFVQLEDLCEKDVLRVHLLYGEKDYKDNLKLLRAAVPSLCSVKQVYTGLQELAAAGAVHCSDAFMDLGKRLPIPTTRHLLEKSVAILREISYIDMFEGIVSPLKAGECYLLEDVVKSKTFLCERKGWEKFLSWQKYMLYTEGEELLSFSVTSSRGQ